MIYFSKVLGELRKRHGFAYRDLERASKEILNLPHERKEEFISRDRFRTLELGRAKLPPKKTEILVLARIYSIRADELEATLSL